VAEDKWIEVPRVPRQGSARVAKPKSSGQPAAAKTGGNNTNRISYVQDAFYQHLIAERISVEIIFLDGSKVRGLIDGFDTYAILVMVQDEELLLFKSAIRGIHRYLGDGNDQIV
jgi:RNA chaperone Hfq